MWQVLLFTTSEDDDDDGHLSLFFIKSCVTALCMSPRVEILMPFIFSAVTYLLFGGEQTLSHFIRCSLSTILSPQLRATTTYNIISCAVVQLSLMRCWWMLSFEYHRKVFMGRFLWQSLGCITFRDRILSVGSESSEDERQGLWLFADDEIVIKY